MKDLIEKLPENAFFDFLKEYWSQIEELFNSLVKFISSVFDKEAEGQEEE